MSPLDLVHKLYEERDRLRADRDRLRAALVELLLSPVEATAEQISTSYDLRQVERDAWEAARAALAATEKP